MIKHSTYVQIADVHDGALSCTEGEMPMGNIHGKCQGNDWEESIPEQAA